MRGIEAFFVNNVFFSIEEIYILCKLIISYVYVMFSKQFG